MVRASIIGAILANLLLATGRRVLSRRLRHHTQEYNTGAARLYSSMMLIAAISLGVPERLQPLLLAGRHDPARKNSSTSARPFVLLAAYGCTWSSCSRRIRTSSRARRRRKTEHGTRARSGALARAIGSLVGASVLAAWMSEILVGAAEGTGKAWACREVFIGIVFLAIVGGAAESGSAIAMARKNKMDLTLGIALGSSIQIALFVAPVLVLASYFIAPQPLELSFSRAEIGSLFLGVLIGTDRGGDGRSNWYKGVQLILVYVDDRDPVLLPPGRPTLMKTPMTASAGSVRAWPCGFRA